MPLQAGAGDLSDTQAVQGGWGLAMLGDKEAASVLLSGVAASVLKVCPVEL